MIRFAVDHPVATMMLFGALLVTGANGSKPATILGAIAVAAAVTNVVGGFLITDRILKMFNKKKAK